MLTIITTHLLSLTDSLPSMRWLDPFIQLTLTQSNRIVFILYKQQSSVTLSLQLCSLCSLLWSFYWTLFTVSCSVQVHLRGDVWPSDEHHWSRIRNIINHLFGGNWHISPIMIVKSIVGFRVSAKSPCKSNCWLQRCVLNVGLNRMPKSQVEIRQHITVWNQASGDLY